MNAADLDILLQKYLDGVLSTDEYAMLAEEAHAQSAEWQQALGALIGKTEAAEQYNHDEWKTTLEFILQQPPALESLDRRGKVRVIRGPWKWIAAAAVVVVLAGLGYWQIHQQQDQRIPTIVQTSENAGDVLPGGNRAVLTLADGRKIILDSTANGVLATEGIANVTKNNGAITYEIQKDRQPEENITYNTMTTPRGGQYHLKLSDGSQVWLNAASSITYPTAFTGNDRKVTITGEAYFEITKDKKKKFIVTVGTAEGLKIEVLGTHFNVHAYAEDGPAKTSLLEGVVRINKSVLAPGQAYVNGKVLQTDVEADVAWKNGFFSFDNAGIEEVMRQVSRWYDVEVEYRGARSSEQFSGEIDRMIPLSNLLKHLERSRIHYKIENRKLIILP